MATLSEKLAQGAGGNIRESVSLGKGGTARPATARRETPEERKGIARDDAAYLIELDRIIPDPEQPRKEFDAEKLEETAASLRTFGQIQPIAVRWSASDNLYKIVDGERRYRAARIAGLAKLRAIVEDPDQDPATLVSRQLVANLHRDELKGIEAANAYRKLMDLHGWSANRLAEHLSIPVSKVSRALTVLAQPEEIRELVEAGSLSVAAAYEASKIEDPAERVATAREVAERGLTRDEARAVVEAKIGAEGAEAKARRARKGGRPSARKVATRLPTSWKYRDKATGYAILAERKKGIDPASLLGFLRSAVAAYEADHPEVAAAG